MMGGNDDDCPVNLCIVMQSCFMEVATVSVFDNCEVHLRANRSGKVQLSFSSNKLYSATWCSRMKLIRNIVLSVSSRQRLLYI